MDAGKIMAAKGLPESLDSGFCVFARRYKSGSGGRAVAEYLEYAFLDLDQLIEERSGSSVQTIFAELGEPEFRRLEHDAIRACTGLSRSVIALGGGAYASEENRSLVRTMGKAIWLDCPL